MAKRKGNCHLLGHLGGSTAGGVIRGTVVDGADGMVAHGERGEAEGGHAAHRGHRVTVFNTV